MNYTSKTWYDVIKDNEIISGGFETKEEAVNYAIKNNAEYIVKIKDCEPVDVVWDTNIM